MTMLNYEKDLDIIVSSILEDATLRESYSSLLENMLNKDIPLEYAKKKLFEFGLYPEVSFKTKLSKFTSAWEKWRKNFALQDQDLIVLQEGLQEMIEMTNVVGKKSLSKDLQSELKIVNSVIERNKL